MTKRCIRLSAKDLESAPNTMSPEEERQGRERHLEIQKKCAKREQKRRKKEAKEFRQAHEVHMANMLAKSDRKILMTRRIGFDLK